MAEVIHAVAGILHKEHRILIAERPAGKPYAGYWEFPGGKIEKDESGEQALTRELAEELGITVLSATFLFTHQHAYPDKAIVLQVWRVDQFEGLPEGRENQLLEWSPFDQIKNYKIFEGNHAILGKLLSESLLVDSAMQA